MISDDTIPNGKCMCLCAWCTVQCVLWCVSPCSVCVVFFVCVLSIVCVLYVVCVSMANVCMWWEGGVRCPDKNTVRPHAHKIKFNELLNERPWSAVIRARTLIATESFHSVELQVWVFEIEQSDSNTQFSTVQKCRRMWVISSWSVANLWNSGNLWERSVRPGRERWRNSVNHSWRRECEDV